MVLVFHLNDYKNNFGELQALANSFHPERYPYVNAVRDGQGAIGLRPPSADYAAHRLPIGLWKQQWVLPLGSLGFPRDLYLGDTLDRLLDEAAKVSYFVSWLGNVRFQGRRKRIDRLESSTDDYEHWVDDWSWLHDLPPNRGMMFAFRQEDLPPILERGLDYTAFGLDRFKERAERDGFRLAILTTWPVGTRGDPSFDRIDGLAGARGIPVIAQHDHIIRRGGRFRDAIWAHDRHWSPVGHRWAAEALLEWIDRNRDVCRPRAGAPRDGP